MPEAARRSPTRDALVFGLALALAALAGFIDAAGFIAFGGLFVSFMAGDGTRAAIHASGDLGAVVAPVRVIVVFVVGIVVGELIGAAAGRWGRVVVLAIETVLLWAALAAARAQAGDAVVTSLLAFAMGAQNASVHRSEGVDVALTYVTGMIVHIGRAIAHALLGDGGWRTVAPLSALWAAVLIGSLAGGLIARHSILHVLTIAAAVATILTVAALGLTVATARA